MSANCYDRHKRIMKVTSIMAAICGGDIFNPNYRVTFHTWVVVAAILAFYVLSVYNMYHSYVIVGDWKLMLQSLSVLGSALQGLAKLVDGVTLRTHIRSLFDSVDQIYKDYENNTDFKPALTKQVTLTAYILKCAASLIAVTCVVVITHPLVYNHLYGGRLPIIPFLIPGLSPDTDKGYIIYCFYHSFCVILSGFGNCAGDMMVFVGIAHVPLLKDVFKIKCKLLGREINSNSKDQKKITADLRDILKWHQHYTTYVETAERVYYFIIFVQVFTSVFGICCTSFCIITKSWPAAFVYLIYCTCTLYAYCALGNLVELANDDIEVAIYGDIVWYELPTSEQKEALLMLRKSQRSVTLTVGSIMPLSMATALQLTKCIYSYLMMLVRFLGDDQ